MIVGYCEKCGAAVRQQFEGAWNAIVPPPLHYDCSCRNVAVITTNSSTPLSFSSSGKVELSKTITGKAELTENVIPQSEEIALLRKQLDEAQNTIAKLKALGNAVVPQVAELVGRAINACL